jgi:hypothetical protein
VEEISQKVGEIGRPLEKVETLKQEIQAIQQQLLAKI